MPRVPGVPEDVVLFAEANPDAAGALQGMKRAAPGPEGWRWPSP